MMNQKKATAAVQFNEYFAPAKKLNEREKYLTAKYPAEQMQLIRKRLKIEFWLDEQLRNLYNVRGNGDHKHCPADLLDSLLDIDDSASREKYLLLELIDVKQSQSVIKEFIEQLLIRVKML